MDDLLYLAEPLIAIFAIVFIVAICIKVSNNVWGKYRFTDDNGKKSKNQFIRQRKPGFVTFFDDDGSYSSYGTYYAFLAPGGLVAFRLFDKNENKIVNKTDKEILFAFDVYGDKGQIKSTAGWIAKMLAGSDMIMLDIGTPQEFIKILKNNKKLRIVIKTFDGCKPHIHVQFFVPRANFIKLYDSIPYTQQLVKEKTSTITATEVQNAVRQYLKEIEWNGDISNNDDGIIFDTYLDCKNLKRYVKWGGIVVANSSMFMVSLTLGRVSADTESEAEKLIEKYNATKKSDDFQAKLIRTDDGFDPGLYIVKYVYYTDKEDLVDKIHYTLKEALKVVEEPDLIPFLDVTRELE